MKKLALIVSAIFCSPFVAVEEALRAAGFSVPRIYAQDLDRGLLLLEDLGAEAETLAAAD